VTLTHAPLGIQCRNAALCSSTSRSRRSPGSASSLQIELGSSRWVGRRKRALSAALAGALLLTWTDRRWPAIQEAIIGVSFVLTASGTLLLLAANPHGGEHLKDLLVGQILWVAPSALVAVALAYGVLLAVWFGLGTRMGRTGFYVVFRLRRHHLGAGRRPHLVFATLIVPALATRGKRRARTAVEYFAAILGYAVGLVVATLSNLPAGPAIVWLMVLLAILLRFAAPVAHRG
jgi:zinc/manganese transport system permease protein